MMFFNLRFFFVTPDFFTRRWFAPPVEVVALENTTLVLRGPGPFGLVGDSGAGKRCSPPPPDVCGVSRNGQPLPFKYAPLLYNGVSHERHSNDIG